MFELTNEQRRCFGISPVEAGRELLKAPAPDGWWYQVYAYVDGTRVRKQIVYCEAPERARYAEADLDERLSEDRTMLLPKTSKGKPQRFTAGNLEKRTPVGMGIRFFLGNVSVFNESTQQGYYNMYYEGIRLPTMEAFADWVERWCAETGEADLRDVAAFAARQREHQKFREGDFFRFRIARRRYGYGRVLLDYSRLRREKVPFWDMFAGKPLCVAVYRVVTERADLTPEELVGKKLLPGEMIMDNALYYGEFAVIGNRPLEPGEGEFPIHYGRSISVREPGLLCYQCGRTYRTLSGAPELYPDFRNGGIGWSLDVELPVLLACIRQDSNLPYWELDQNLRRKRDLRNPRNAKELAEIRRQFGVE